MCDPSYPGIEFAVSQGGSVLSSWAASAVLTGAAAQTPIEQNIPRLNYCRHSEKKLHTASGYNRTFSKPSLTCHMYIELLVSAFIPTPPSILDAKQSFLHVHFVPRLFVSYTVLGTDLFMTCMNRRNDYSKQEMRE